MMRVVTLKDGRNTTILNDSDLEYIIRSEMGDEIGDRVSVLIGNKQDEHDGLREELRYYELAMDSLYDALRDVINEALELEDYIRGAKRVNREEILKRVETIRSRSASEI